MGIKKERIQAFDMTCTSCEARIEKSIKKLEGVMYVKANYSGQFVDVEYDEDLCSTSRIKEEIRDAGYSITKDSGNYKIVGIIMIALAIIFIGKSTQGFDMNKMLNGASYLVLFVVGILTSIHCVGMCGGIMLSQSVNAKVTEGIKNKLESIKPALLYNCGRVISYTILGGIVGGLGSVLSLSLGMQAGLQIFAAVFMIIMGLNMFGVKAFRRFHIRLPWSACSVKNKTRAPLVVGLLNGLMPCGPLQTMQLYALGTGSPVKGALSMLVFSLGTVPLMLTFGAISGLLSKGYTKKLLKFSGIFIIVLGVIMGRRGLALAGVNFPSVSFASLQSSSGGGVNAAKPTIENGVQVVKITADSRGYVPNVIYVEKGTPVKWIIDGKQITSCNNAIVVPSLNIQKKLNSGENVINFTPKKTGDISFSCWMGMIRGVVRVVDNLNTVDTSKADPSLPPAGASGGCCGGGAVTGSAPSNPSIYGDDLSQVSTDRLVKKALIIGNNQSFTINAIGYEFDPLIVVAKTGLQSKFTIDLKKFDNPTGEFTLIDGSTGNTLASFKNTGDSASIEYTFKSAGGYGILKDGQIYGIIEIVDDMKTADLNAIRDKYLK